jgi:hypothetical protein
MIILQTTTANPLVARSGASASIRRIGWGEHGSGCVGVGNTLVPKRDHLVQRRRSVAHLTEGLPQNAGKTLPVKGIGMNGTVRVDHRSVAAPSVQKLGTTC